MQNTTQVHSHEPTDIARDMSERMRIVVGRALNDSDWSIQILYYFIGLQTNWFLANQRRTADLNYFIGRQTISSWPIREDLQI